jgi:hypothetical protein
MYNNGLRMKEKPSSANFVILANYDSNGKLKHGERTLSIRAGDRAMNNGFFSLPINTAAISIQTDRREFDLYRDVDMIPEERRAYRTLYQQAECKSIHVIPNT